MNELICLTTLILNISGQTFGEDRRDINSLKRVINTCATDARYSKTHPCLTKFMKREPGVYWALCGKKEEKPVE